VTAPRLVVVGVAGLPEIRAGDDLAALVVRHADPPPSDGDVVVVTSKVVSKAAGLGTSAERSDLVAAHTDRVVARRGATTIVRTPHGLTLAAAGLDVSNATAGTVLALPADPDAEAAVLRHRLRRSTGANIAVVVTDTAGRPWRLGQTDIAIGVAGLLPLVDLSGVTDSHGNVLTVTAPAVADSVAAAADLVKGKLDHVPAAIVSGLAHYVLPSDQDGPGAGVLLRPERDDLFGWGALDAVRAAVRRDDPNRHRGFALPVDSVETLVGDALAAADDALVRVVSTGTAWDVLAVDGAETAAVWEAAALVERLRVLAVATRRRLVLRQVNPPALATVELVDLQGSAASTA